MRIILPGDLLADKPVRMENGVIEGGKTYATVIGLLDESTSAFIPLETVWYPRQNDFVIGIVEAVRNSVYTINLNSAFKGLIVPRRGFGRERSSIREEELQLGDIVSVFVREVQRESDQIIVLLERQRKLLGGKVLMVRPSKIPRVMGRANTMLKQLETGTQSTILLGQNGVAWIKGGNMALAINAINKIQEEAHLSGLTERIKKMLDEGSK